MSPTAAPADVERLRQRLNILVLILPGQWLPLTVIYWMRFPRPFRPFTLDPHPAWPLVAAACAAAAAVPFLLPASYFQPRRFERGNLYPALGLRLFRRVATDGDWINRFLRRRDPAYRVVRDRTTRADHLAGTISNERWHTAWFVFGLGTQAFAAATGEIGWAVVLGGLNVAFNLYPVFHQRYKRARLRRPFEPATSAPPAAP